MIFSTRPLTDFVLAEAGIECCHVVERGPRHELPRPLLPGAKTSEVAVLDVARHLAFQQFGELLVARLADLWILARSRLELLDPVLVGFLGLLVLLLAR